MRPCWLWLLSLLASCKDVSSYSTQPGENYCGGIVQGAFVRAGFGPGVSMRLRLDADALDRAPGEISTSDKLLDATPLRAIPQLSHDPLLTLQFGEGRRRNLLYAAAPTSGSSLLVVISLMENGDAEARLLRGAPPPEGTLQPGAEEPLFGVFPLKRQKGDCGF